MKNFTVYFEIFGKKMKTTILSENEEMVKEAIKNKIIFHKVEANKTDNNKDIIKSFDDIFDILKNKRP